MSEDIGEEPFSRYFDEQTSLEYRDGRLDLTVPNGFLANLIDRRFGAALRSAAVAETGESADEEVALRIRVARAAGRAEPGERDDSAREAPTEPRREQIRRGGRATRRPVHNRLEEFIVGESNRFAYTTALRMAEGDGGMFSPLFIHGGCGQGKSHLIHGLAHRFRELNPGAVVRFMTGEAFTNAYISAVQSNSLERFRANHRKIDLLCIDDVHFVAGKRSTQNELLHTFDALGLDGALVAMASDEHPAKIAELSRKLASRFVAGAVVKLNPPDAELRLKLVKALASRRRLPLDESGAVLMAERCGRLAEATGNGSVRDIEGMLNQIAAVYELLPDLCTTPGRVGAVLVRKALGIDEPAGGARRARRPVRIDEIIREVARVTGVEIGELMGNARHARLVLARGLAAYVAREMTNHSFPEIARAMGRPNHSSVVTAQKRTVKQIEQNATVRLAGESGEVSVRDLAERVLDGLSMGMIP